MATTQKRASATTKRSRKTGASAASAKAKPAGSANRRAKKPAAGTTPAKAPRTARAATPGAPPRTRSTAEPSRVKRAGATLRETPPATRRTRSASSGASARLVSDKLAKYRSKRDFGKTPEPQGKSPSQWKKTNNPFFVIQKHDATRLHYDFRLEVDGVLKSWAVPKGPSMNPTDKRLAVETEDHPMDYADFEGIIPENEYGGGTVIVWDAGPYRNLKRRGGEEIPMSDCYERGTIEIWLEGKKIRGGFALIHSRMGDNEKNWLLIKMKDATSDASSDPVSERTESVLSGRTLEQVASKPGKVWHSK